MSFTDVFKKIFGTKADRDLKALKPMLNKVLEAYATIDRLSDDELRERCQGLKDKIQAAIADDEARIAEIRQELEKEIPLSQKEALATEQDKLVKKVDEIIEQVLDEVIFLQNGHVLLQKKVDQIREENGKSVDELFREVFRW